MAAMKEALEKAGLKRHLMVQPVGYKTPECLDHNNHASRMGMTALAEFPFGTFLTFVIFARNNWNYQGTSERACE